MKNDKAHSRVPNREFITMIRSALDDAGHPDIAISERWIVQDDTGYSIKVPIGGKLTVALEPRDDFFDAETADELIWNARDYALALVNLKSAEKMLRKYARDVRAVAVKEVAAARAQGLGIDLDGVGFTAARAFNLAGFDWKEAVLYILASVRIVRTSFYLQPEVASLAVGEPAEVVHKVADIVREQRQRQDRLAELQALGADLIVDQITLDLLAAHGLNAEEMLRDAWKQQSVTVKLAQHGRHAWLSLVSCNGSVNARGDLGDCFWTGRMLEVAGDALATSADGLVGRSLGDRVKHPVFTSRPIVGLEHRLGTDSISFDLSDKLMFDGETGRIWRDDRLAA